MAILATVAGALLITQYPEKRARAYNRDKTAFALWSLSIFPQDAVVVSTWPLYTQLAYYQTTRGLRPDVTLVELNRHPRVYVFGLVEGYAQFVAEAIEHRPVMIDIADAALARDFEVNAVNASWFEVKAAEP